MSAMRIRTKAILMNCVLLVTLLVLLRFYPTYAVAISAAILFPVGNVALLLKAKKERTQVRTRC